MYHAVPQADSEYCACAALPSLPLYVQQDFHSSSSPQHPILIIHPQHIVTRLLLGGGPMRRGAPEPFELHVIHQKISGLHQLVDLLQELLFLLPVLDGLVIICGAGQRGT